MEAIIDYKLKDFLRITDLRLINEYYFYLDLLRPVKEILNPSYHKWKIWDKKQSKTIKIKSLRDIKFNQVIEVRHHFNGNDIYKILKSIELVTGCTSKQILDFTITQAYGIINYIKQELFTIAEMEKLLIDDGDDNHLEAINAYARMAKFAEFNTIDSLAKGDILKWEEIGELPYKMVFTKLMMDKEKHNIQKELDERQKRKSN